MSNNILVFTVGDSVIIGDDIEAKITSVWICANRRILYQVCWWNGRSREEKWLEEFEVQGTPGEQSEKMSIGFHSKKRHQ